MEDLSVLFCALVSFLVCPVGKLGAALREKRECGRRERRRDLHVKKCPLAILAGRSLNVT